METHTTNIVKRHSDGAMVNVRFEPVENIKSALRFNRTEDFVNMINGHHRPSDPADYYLQPVKITYEEVEHERNI